MATMHQTTTDDSLRIGELAERAGLTIGTLHHYDQIGLVRTSERAEAGHRRYAEADVRRLYQVVALRSLGVPLAGIARALERRVHAEGRGPRFGSHWS